MSESNRSQPVRVGIAGLGRSGWRNHAQPVASMPECYRIVATTDANPARADEAKEAFGARPCKDFDELLAQDDVELVIIATPNHLHPQQAIQAMEAGKDVVCEKPMAPTLAEADQMIEAAKRTGRLLTIFQNRRLTPDLLKIREIIESGELGHIVKVSCRIHKFARRWDWQTLRQYGGGELNNTASHFVDELLQLAGDGEMRVFSRRAIALAAGDAEDVCTILIEIPDSPLLEVEVSAAAAYPDDVWHVQGTRGGLRGSMQELRWKTCNVDALPPREAEHEPTPDRSYNREELTWSEERVWRVPEDAESTQVSYYKSLHETLRGGAPLAVTPESVRRQIEVLEACRNQGEIVPIRHASQVLA